MAKPILSRKKAQALSVGLMLIGLGILTYAKVWWPPLLLVIGIPLALRQYLLGKRFDMVISIFIFVGAYITIQFSIKWEMILPILFAVGGIYILVREFFIKKDEGTITKDNDYEDKG